MLSTIKFLARSLSLFIKVAVVIIEVVICILVLKWLISIGGILGLIVGGSFVAILIQRTVSFLDWIGQGSLDD
jgi:hypothetical protein